ncbi:hypothetical protein KUV86_08380 [Halomonas sp. DP8Y7-3]|uniref:hypothetical protein n=1 Tax=Halomonas sp. DP8Y7-3 TaxID=2859079 RepID=UPI001C98A798|nr:hypothetical protein [Halomonas sp. DP8Y7-3]MBY5929127.1 hypothetical protein [Halomonas sp. DP8Y7-3]
MIIFPEVVSISVSKPSMWPDLLPSLAAGLIGVFGVIIGAFCNHALNKRREERAIKSSKEWWVSEVKGMLEDGIEAMKQLENSYNEVKRTHSFEKLVGPRQFDGVFVFDKELIVKGEVSQKERRPLQYIKLHIDIFSRASQELRNVIYGENKRIGDVLCLILKMYEAAVYILYNIRVMQGEVEYSSISRIGQEALQEERERVWEFSEQLSGTSIPMQEIQCESRGGPGCRG